MDRLYQDMQEKMHNSFLSRVVCATVETQKAFNRRCLTHDAFCVPGPTRPKNVYPRSLLRASLIIEHIVGTNSLPCHLYPTIDALL